MKRHIREAVDSDKQTISDLVLAAFGDVQGHEIAELVTDLLKDSSAQPSLSLVAVADDQVVGHILFTIARVKDSQREVVSAILAPLSVHPENQGKGIAGQLIREGLEQLKRLGVELVFVLGHPAFYPKYGFSTAGTQGFEAPYPIPPENSDAWMVQEILPGVIGRIRGQILCSDALNDPKYWRE